MGHDIRNDLRVLDLLDFNFSNFDITTLDTQAMSYGSPILRRLLLTLGCPFTKLHCGGNDANFTLKALLLLAVGDCITQPGTERRLATMKEICLNPLSHHVRLQTEITEVLNFSRTDPQIKALKKKAKRLQRSRKHQSKLWDSKMQGKSVQNGQLRG